MAQVRALHRITNDRGRARRRKAVPSISRADELTAAALDLFAERNFASVTIKDIASAIGVNTALIYYYFESKEELFRATIEAAVDRAFAHFRELCRRHSHPADIISDWLDNHVDLYDPIQKLVKVSLDYAGTHRRVSAIDRSIQQFYDEEARVLSSCIRDGIKQGLFRSVETDRLAQFISGYLDGLMVRSVILPGFDLRASVDYFRQLLWEELGYQPNP